MGFSNICFEDNITFPFPHLNAENYVYRLTDALPSALPGLNPSAMNLVCFSSVGLIASAPEVPLRLRSGVHVPWAGGT